MLYDMSVVLTCRSNFKEKIGGASGAFINIVSKSGSNVPHGSLYGFFRNDAMDARDPFAFSSALAKGQAFDPALPDSVARAVENSLKREQFGGTVGFHKERSDLPVWFLSKACDKNH